jgi:hypothetical protein
MKNWQFAIIMGIIFFILPLVMLPIGIDWYNSQVPIANQARYNLIIYYVFSAMFGSVIGGCSYLLPSSDADDTIKGEQ